LPAEHAPVRFEMMIEPKAGCRAKTMPWPPSRTCQKHAVAQRVRAMMWVLYRVTEMDEGRNMCSRDLWMAFILTASLRFYKGAF